VGERTYGDAAVRKAITMDDGGAVILSVAKYYAPTSAKAIQDTGVVPSVPMAEVEASQADPDDDQTPQPQPDATPTPKPTGEDKLLKKAIEVVNGGGKSAVAGNSTPAESATPAAKPRSMSAPRQSR
jgi:carboxyl-terminal processing protease